MRTALALLFVLSAPLAADTAAGPSTEDRVEATASSNDTCIVIRNVELICF